MNKAQAIFKALGQTVNKNSPSILIGLGIGGFFSAIGLAVAATPKAMDALDNELYNKFQEETAGKADHISFTAFTLDGYELGYSINDRFRFLSEDPAERRQMIFKLCAPYYIPAVGTAVLSTVMILLGNKIHLRRTAALAGLYKVAEDSLRTYQEKTLEEIGANKEKKVRGEVAQQALTDNPVNETMIHNEGGGHELCYDMFTGRYFYSTASKIHAAVNKFNEELLSENTKVLNELYYDLGLPAVEIGDKIGWNLDQGMVEVYLGAKIATDDRPCITLEFIKRPQYLLNGGTL